jgi:hypothetical protein
MPRLPPAVRAGVKRKRSNRGLAVAKGSRESQPRSGPAAPHDSETDNDSPSTTDDDENGDVACGGAGLEENLEDEGASKLGAVPNAATLVTGEATSSAAVMPQMRPVYEREQRILVA